MAILIDQNLSATPNPGAFGQTITFRQALHSDQAAGEIVSIRYRLSRGHNVWFERSGGDPSKEIRFNHVQIAATSTPLEHSFLIVQGPGVGPMDNVEVDCVINTAAPGDDPVSNFTLLGIASTP
ncbi:MAG: hypothetical protein U0002_15085 [Thermoanaerobaculia bacterium]